MALEQKLNLKMAQKLIMTPSLQQAIKLLQLSKLELVEEIAQELVENPVLEEEQGEEGAEEAAAAQGESGERPPGESAPASGQEVSEVGQEKQPLDDSELDYYFREWENSRSFESRIPQEEREIPSIDNTPSRPPSLADHLLWQLADAATSEKAHEIGRAIIGNIDEEGYLQATVEEICEMGGWTADEVEHALRMVQRLDPIGIAARDLNECLILQLRHLDMLGGAAESIVREHLDLVRAHRYADLAKRLGLPEEEVRDIVEVIRHLDPKPGLRYSAERAPYVTPDVYVLKVDNEYKILLNEEGLPRLKISPVYRRMLEKGASTSQEAKSFVREKFRSALWFIKSLEERQRTIYKVSEAIVRHQREFLDHGIEKLRPLILRDIADDVQMHESTISRVVTNKYMHTPRGLFEMKFFFHSGISSESGEDISSLTVKSRIRKIIEGEDSRRPLSDSKIARLLKEEGLHIARRTVAKYREELHIPASPVRKRM